MLSVLKKHKQSERGVVLVIAVLVLMLGVISALVASNTTRLNVVTSGKMRGMVSAGYDAEACLYKALSKIRQTDDFFVNTSNDPGTVPNRLWGTFDKSVDDVAQLTDCEQRYDWDNPDLNHEVVTDDGKVMCNYLGRQMDNVRASLRRDVDFQDKTAGHQAAVYLLSCVAKKGEGYERMQAVVLLPLSVFNFSVATQDPNSKAYFGAQITVN